MELALNKDNYLDGQNGVTSKIKNSIDRVNKEFVYIGFLLWEVREYKYYLDKGYSGVIDYAEQELNFKKSTTYNFIKLCEKFSKRTSSGSPSMHLDEKYKDFKYAQLIELSTLKNFDNIDISPDMSVRDIKKSKRLENETSKQVANEIFNKFMEQDPLLGQMQVDQDSNIVEVQFNTFEDPAPADINLLNELEYKKLYDLIYDRHILIENFIAEGYSSDSTLSPVAAYKTLVSERDLLESLLKKIEIFKS